MTGAPPVPEAGQDVAAWMAAWAHGELESPAARFDRLARQLFDRQIERIAPFALYAGARGVRTAGDLAVTSLPLVPVGAFKSAALYTQQAAAAPAVRFETSGTSDGRPGVVQLADSALYNLSLRAAFHHFVVPDAPLRLTAAPAEGPFRVISLVPDRRLRPASSLGHMVDVVGQTWGDGPVRWMLSADERVDQTQPAGRSEVLDIDRLLAELAQATAANVPVLLLSTSIGLALLRDVWPENKTFSLPSGSRIMDTGGPKGRAIELSREAQHGWLTTALGVPPAFIVGELGMTELGSQRYETVTRAHLVGDMPAQRCYVGPPWLRSFALAPGDLRALSAETVGLIGHIDLANLDTCAFVLTADTGRMVPIGGGLHGLELAGRVPGSEWRGCGLDVEDLLAGGSA
ncbi:MAG: hypothetical protein KC502_09040 [Myxococcales bacterium]|nr:hypothetical protein [Myxococcales bacterium]